MKCVKHCKMQHDLENSVILFNQIRVNYCEHTPVCDAVRQQQSSAVTPDDQGTVRLSDPLPSVHCQIHYQQS